jgi:hypothetical protein
MRVSLVISIEYHRERWGLGTSCACSTVSDKSTIGPDPGQTGWSEQQEPRHVCTTRDAEERLAALYLWYAPLRLHACRAVRESAWIHRYLSTLLPLLFDLTSPAKCDTSCLDLLQIKQ